MSTNFDNGLRARGVPILPTLDGDAGASAFIGTVYYASTSNGSDSNNGLSPTAAKATIQAALNETTTLKNDVVFVEDGTYTETLTMTKANVSLIGQSRYGTKIVGATDATDTLIITGNNCRISNFSVNTYDNGSDVSDIYINDGDGCIVANCYFEQGQYQLEVNASDQVQVLGCLFDEAVGYGAAIYMLDSNQCAVKYCTIASALTNHGILHEDADDLEVAYNSGLGTDEAGTAGVGGFVAINGTDTSSRIIVHDNMVSLFAGVVVGVNGSTAVTGISAVDFADMATTAGSYMGNNSAGNTLLADNALA